MQPKPDPIKHCPACGAMLVRKRFNGRLEDRTRFLKRIYCGEKCMGVGMVQATVSLAGYRDRAQKLRGTTCEACGATTGLHAHHRDEDPSNNTPENIATLCGSCHLKWHWANGKTSGRPPKPCVVDGCECSARRRGYCEKHYLRVKRWGDPHLVKRNQHSPLTRLP